jgi:hypothetical protein
MKLTSLCLVVTAAFMAAGCHGKRKPAGSNDTTPNPANPAKSPMTQNELCGLYVAAAANSTRLGTAGSSNVDADLCSVSGTTTAETLSDEQVRRACRPGEAARRWADGLLEAIRDRRLTVDWEQARRCLNESRQLRANEPRYRLLQDDSWGALRSGSCTAFFQGRVGAAQQCVDAWDCAPGLRCVATEELSSPTVCLPPAGEGEACLPLSVTAYGRFCAPGLVCDATGKCLPQRAAGNSCQDDAECLSGICKADKTCRATLAGLGEGCGQPSDCAGGCVTCRASEPSGALACQRPAEPGEYCATSSACVGGAGCVGHVCGLQGLGGECASNDGLCQPGLACVGPLECMGLATVGSCNAKSPACVWSSGSSRCDGHVLGGCATPPADGPCLPSLVIGSQVISPPGCAAGSYCSSASTCVRYAAVGEACSPDGVEAPWCAGCSNLGCADLACVSGACQYVCARDEDCLANQRCNLALQPATCEAVPADGCHTNDVCPESAYCRISAAACVVMASEQSCATQAGCTWVPFSQCDTPTHCTAIASESDCLAAGCFFDAQLKCMPDCLALPDPSHCSAHIQCAWRPALFVSTGFGCWPGCFSYSTADSCVTHPEPYQCAALSACTKSGECTPRLSGGQTCDLRYQGHDCQTGLCLRSSDGTPRCESPDPARDRHAPDILSLIFLFG